MRLEAPDDKRSTLDSRRVAGAPAPGAALRTSFRDGYGWAHLRGDVLAGMVVGIIALPLSMALAIASGVPPQHGLYTAIVAGAVAALLGGSRVQVTGPTAAFVVLLAPVTHTYGVGGLLMATSMAGLILLCFGLARLGQLIQFIPYPVTTGFTAGIAIVIATLQIKDALGLRIEHMPEHFIERATTIARALTSARPAEAFITALTLLVLVGWPRITRRVPAPLVALTLTSILVVALESWVPGFEVETIGDRFVTTVDGVAHRGIPALPPTPLLPWQQSGADGQPLSVDRHLLRALLGPAFAIAILGAIESLLSAVVADGMTGQRHDPDSELMAQGIANIIAPFFGGIAATGAIARTATNVRAGGRSPIASITHAVFVLLAMVTLAPLLGHLPMASLAALLMLVAWNMSEARHVLHALRVAPRSDVFIMLTCLTLTVVFDMVVSVSVGVVLASVLFMRRMVEVSDARWLEPESRATGPKPVPGTLVYRIAGPLFFGAAQKAMSALQTIDSDARNVIIDLSSVPAIDQTGLVNLQSTLAKLTRGRRVIVVGVHSQPERALRRAGMLNEVTGLEMAADVDEALARVTSADSATTS